MNLLKETAYVFEFETFEVELPDDEENPNIFRLYVFSKCYQL